MTTRDKVIYTISAANFIVAGLIFLNAANMSMAPNSSTDFGAGKPKPTPIPISPSLAPKTKGHEGPTPPAWASQHKEVQPPPRPNGSPAAKPPV